MKFKHIFLLSALVLSLFSCTSVNDTTNPGDNTNEEKPGDDNNNENPGDDNNNEEKPGDDNNNEKPGDDNNGEETPSDNDWTEEEKSLMKKYLNGEVLPYFHLDGCSLYYDEMIETVTYSGGKGTSLDTAKYAKILENNGFIIDEDNSDSTIGCYYFIKQFELFDFYVQVYNLDEDDYCVESGDFYIDAYILTYSETWDAELVETYFPGTKDNLVPFEDAYLYYCGTAEEKPVLSFSMNVIKNEENGKVSFSKIGEDKFYYIKIGNNTLYFSLPSIMIAYNKIIDLFDSNENIEIIDFKKLIRDEIYDYYVRAYSIYYLTENENNPEWRNEFRNYMLSFFAEEQIIFNIDCKKGIVKIKATIKESNTALNKIIEENAGNMIKSPYLTISDRVFPIKGKIDNYILITSNSSINNFIIICIQVFNFVIK